MPSDPRERIQAPTPTILLLVGQDSEPIMIPTRHIQSITSLMSLANKSGVINLPNEEPEVMRAVAHYLSTGRLQCIIDDASTDAKIHEKEYLLLAKLYCSQYASKFLRNLVVDAIVAKSTVQDTTGNVWYPSLRVVKYVFDHGPANCKLRELLLCMLAESYVSLTPVQLVLGSENILVSVLERVQAVLRQCEKDGKIQRSLWKAEKFWEGVEMCGG